MKKITAVITLLALAGIISAQSPRPISKTGKEHPLKAQRKYQILVENERSVKKVQDANRQLLDFQETSRSERFLLGALLWQGVTSALTQKTVNATSNLASLGISYLSESLKSDREKWYRKAQQQCYYSQPLSAETKIDDFYALPSTKGFMDPENLKFEGFGCRNYIEVIGDSGEGVGVFYIFCKMRRDSIGIRHIVNHSKFLVEIDSLIFNPMYCNLPNDSTGSAESRFFFEKRASLNLELKTRFYSSWINQASMVINNELLGEFTIKVKIDKKKLNSQGLFVYDRNDKDYEKLISIDGDCFIVPRSYTGTLDGENYLPSWGTGQYRIEMDVSERCDIVDSYYQIRESGNGEAVAFADATPGKKKWDKAKWKVEWKAMNSRRKGNSFIKNAWKCVVSAYKGTGWVATFTDPLTTALYSWETQKLDNWLGDMQDKIFGENTAGILTSGNSKNSVPTSSTGPVPVGNSIPGGSSSVPKTGVKPQ